MTKLKLEKNPMTKLKFSNKNENQSKV